MIIVKGSGVRGCVATGFTDVEPAARLARAIIVAAGAGVPVMQLRIFI